MGAVLSIDERAITGEELLPLLVKYRLLPQLAREIIIDQAIANFECTPEEVTAIRQQFAQQYQINSEEQLQAWLQQQAMSKEQLEAQLIRKHQLEKFKQETWGNRLETIFLERKRQFDRVVYSLLRTQEPGVAQELFFRIQEGETSFAELAKEYSQGSEAQTGGLIGPVELQSPHPKLAQLLSTSQPGQLCPPTKVGDWWVIIRLEKYLSAQLDQSMRQRLLDECFQSWLNEQVNTKVSLTSDAETSATVS